MTAQKANQHGNITANEIAHHLILNEKVAQKKIKSKIDRRISDSDPVLISSFSEELKAGIQSMKKDKAVGLDNIFVEEVKHFGSNTKSWQLVFQ